MGINNEFANDLSPIVVDIETCGLPNAADFLEPVEPDARLKDPEKIAASIREKTEAREAKLALDWNVGRIVALAWWTEAKGTRIYLGKTEQDETMALSAFWVSARQRTIVGFNCKGFDLKFMIQRSRYLGVTHPTLDLGKYTRKGIVDLFSELTFNDGTYDQGAMRRSLKAFARRFGLPVSDTVSGAEIPALVATGEWDQISAHVRSDVELTLALARRLGVVQPAREAVAL